MDKRDVYTKSVIELALKLKKSGVEWVPEEGDWFADGAPTRRLVVMITDKEYSDIPYAIWTYRGNLSWDSREYIWLPDLQQVSDEIIKRRKKFVPELSLIAFESGAGEAYLSEAHQNILCEGETLLEAAYKLLLEVLQGEE